MNANTETKVELYISNSYIFFILFMYEYLNVLFYETTFRRHTQIIKKIIGKNHRENKNGNKCRDVTNQNWLYYK